MPFGRCLRLAELIQSFISAIIGRILVLSPSRELQAILDAPHNRDLLHQGRLAFLKHTSPTATMPRGGGSDSEDSIRSHITVLERDSTSPAPPHGMAADARSSVGASSLQSTPPTSLDGSTGDMDAPKGGKQRRVSRARSSLSTLADENDDETSATKGKASRSKQEAGSKTASRAVSGATLVEGSNKKETMEERMKKELDINMHWPVADNEPAEDSNGGIKRRTSRRSQIAALASEATSALGKRARDATDTLKDKVTAATTRTTRAQAPPAPESPPKRVKTIATSQRIFPNLPLPKPKEITAPAVEQPQEPPKPVREPKVRKKYQERGLFAGQERKTTTIYREGKKKREIAYVIERENPVLPLPMFGALC